MLFWQNGKISRLHAMPLQSEQFNRKSPAVLNKAAALCWLKSDISPKQKAACIFLT